jgi:hypothetical protein
MKGVWNHFDGLASQPTTAGANPTAAETVVIDQWDKDECSVRSLLTKLPDSTVVLVHGKKMVRERWEVVVSESLKKSRYL